MTDNAQNEALLYELKKRLGIIKYLGTLGDSDDASVSTVDEPGRPGIVRVRLHNDDVPYRTVKSGLLGGYSPYPGSPVVVGYDEKGDLAIEKADFDALVEANINPLVFNTGDNRIAGFTQTDGFLPLWCGAVSEEIGTASTKVAIDTFRYVDSSNTVHWFQGQKIDLAAFIPAANMHRYVALFLQADDTIQVVGSTAIATITPLQEVDKQECFDARDNRTIPIWLFHLHNAQTSITNADKVEDLRPWMTITATAKIETTYIDDGDSPYTILDTDEVLFCDTTAGVITANLPTGVESQHFVIKCVGANTLTVDPNGTEELYGAGAGVASTLSKGENIDIHYSADMGGWW